MREPKLDNKTWKICIKCGLEFYSRTREVCETCRKFEQRKRHMAKKKGGDTY